LIRPVAFLLALVAILPSVCASPTVATQAEKNNGTDPTRPRTQLLTLYDFENLPGPAPDSSNTFTLRAIQKLTVDDHWSGSLRVDVPLVLTNAASSDDPDGGFAFGSGALDGVATRLTRDQLIRQVLQGGGNMPAYAKQLRPPEVTALVAFLETLRPENQPAARDAAVPATPAPAPG
jgi:hypothetical protein